MVKFADKVGSLKASLNFGARERAKIFIWVLLLKISPPLEKILDTRLHRAPSIERPTSSGRAGLSHQPVKSLLKASGGLRFAFSWPKSWQIY